jgi:dicarboxylate transporter 10
MRLCEQGSQSVRSMLKPLPERYNYRNSIQGLYRMTKEEGFSSWGRGIVPNGARAVLMNMSQLAR